MPKYVLLKANFSTSLLSKGREVELLTNMPKYILLKIHLQRWVLEDLLPSGLLGRWPFCSVF
jgi:hypothetical protein